MSWIIAQEQSKKAEITLLAICKGTFFRSAINPIDAFIIELENAISNFKIAFNILFKELVNPLSSLDCKSNQRPSSLVSN